MLFENNAKIANRYFETPQGLKIADIDPRKYEYDNCFTISDKARNLGGSVLTAMMYLYN